MGRRGAWWFRGWLAAASALALTLTACSAVPPAPSASAPPEPTSSPSAAATITTTPTIPPVPPAATPSEPEPLPLHPDGPFELPLEGSTGFVTVATDLAKVDGLPGGRLRPGDSFTIEADQGKHWIVRSGRKAGRLLAARQLVNLPDLIPSIVYHDVNADASVFRSSGVDLPGITGERLYETRGFNDKLRAEEYFMPVLYPMAARIMTAQQAALTDGSTLIMYQTFRPHDTQKAVAKALTRLHRKNRTVRAGIDGGGWGISSFIAVNLSNHQLGIAIDVSLGEVTGTETRQGRDHGYLETSAEEYPMQTPMHELSRASASFARPVRTRTGTAWKKARLNKNMTRAAKRLRGYCIDAGLTPISSEWWHFDDWAAARASAPGSNGRYRLRLP